MPSLPTSMLAVGFVLLAGCAGGGGGCPEGSLKGTVREASGNAILMLASEGHDGLVWLQLRDATEVYARNGGDCATMPASLVRLGDAIEAVAEGPWMESYPPQTVPSAVVIG